MANTEAMYSKILLDAGDSQKSNSSRAFKVGIAFFGGAGLVLLGIMALSTYSPTLLNSSAVESTTSLFGITSSLRKPMVLPAFANQLPGASPWKELALAGIQDANRCDRGVSTNAHGVKSVLASMNKQDRAIVQAAAGKAEDFLKAGQFAPLGFWDPLGLSVNLDEGQLMYYREAELKHGRVCMLATLGFVVAEKFHPLFGGNIDVPSAFVGTTELAATQQSFWLAAGLAMALPEILAPQALSGRFDGEDRLPGDLGFDPLGLKPKKESDLVEMQNKELANGRLAMIAISGAIAQELVTGQKLDIR